MLAEKALRPVAPTLVTTFAKWPPDEDPAAEAAGGGGAGGGGGFDYGTGDGDFKKGSIKPGVIAVAGLSVVGIAVAGIMMVKTASTTVDPKQEAIERKQIQLLSRKEQMPEWRKWASQEAATHIRQEAFAELAWAKDPDAVPLLIKGLGATDHAVRGRAAQALLEYGLPPAVPGVAEQVKPALLKAFKESDASDKPQIAWALAVFKESSIFPEILNLYLDGHLEKVQRLDEGMAFDAETFAELVPLEKWASLIDDPVLTKKPNFESVKQLVATSLSRTGDDKWTATLTKLVQDKSVDVAREAAVGLGKIANEASLAPLLSALEKADKPSRQRFLEALRDGVGAKGLVIALRSVTKSVTAKEEANRFEVEKARMAQILGMLKELQDPRGADELNAFLQTNPAPHWKTEAALRMAEVGDVRSAAALGWRLKQDPLKLYTKEQYLELTRNDDERVVSARMLADLAILYPEKRGDLRRDAEDGAIHWSTELPQPHANGMRFLAAVQSQPGLVLLKKWADPKVALPKEGQQQPSDEWNVAQSALHYLGWAKDGWGILEKQINRKEAKLDISQASLMQGGLAVLGMSLRGLGVGASDGFAEWGDPKAAPLLVKHIEDAMNHEGSRENACFALAFASSDADMQTVAKKISTLDSNDPKKAFLRACYLETVTRKPVPEVTKIMVDLIDARQPMEVRLGAARAVGFAGLSPELGKALFDKLKDDNVRNYAALALILGGDSDLAARTMRSYEDARNEVREELKGMYDRALGYWSDRNYERGDVVRWINNAEAVAHVKVKDAFQDWVRVTLSRSLIQGVETYNGPHAMTRVQFRVRLMQDARSTDAAKQVQTISTLKFLKEKGVLMSLRHEKAPLGDLARQAFFEVMNPKTVTDAIPEAKAKK
ncbi:MAG: HEAT repeat domain-containing protein [Polyangiaceae bacterium]|nr:HEAT repeat domain-containing protein [Polyangiaceae bacterium]